MARRGQTKSRMVDSAVKLLREQGAAAVTVDAVLSDSGAPRGSVYHHFPGGRDELLLTAAHSAAGYIDHLIETASEEGDPLQFLHRFAEFWAQSLVDSDYRAGCPVVALAVDARDDLPEAATLVAAAFTKWRNRLTEVLVAGGADRATAAARAVLTISAVEGAIVLARAERSTQSLDDLVEQLATLIAPAGAQR